jgi:hypothetical protein
MESHVNAYFTFQTKRQDSPFLSQNSEHHKQKAGITVKSTDAVSGQLPAIYCKSYWFRNCRYFQLGLPRPTKVKVRDHKLPAG